MIYWNNGGTLVPGDSILSGVFQTTAFDFNNDGWLDFASNERIVRLHVNRRDGTFEALPQVWPGASVASLMSADYDGDSDFDLLLRGVVESPVPSILRNDGAANFTTLPLRPGIQVQFGNWLWGDYDNDSDLDLIVIRPGQDIQFFANTLVPAGDPGFTRIRQHPFGEGENNLFLKPRLMDADNDGMLDLVSANSIHSLHADASFTTTVLIPETFEHFSRFDGTWGDYDGDADPDLAISGTDGTTGLDVIRIYRNDSRQSSNEPPRVTGGLRSVVSGNYVRLFWNSSIDDLTPPQSLSYNVRIGTTPGADDAVASLSTASGR